MADFNDICKANETIKTTDIKGKAYAEVNQRIKAFRMLYPMGSIQTEMISNENGICIFKATVYGLEIDDRTILGTGHAYEKESSSFINKTSYIENCETSAVGRALAMCGIGIDTSIASAEEVGNAIANQQEEKPDPVYLPTDDKVVTTAQWNKLASEMNRTGATESYICQTFNVKTINEMSQAQVITALNKFKNTPSKGKK